jgi:hypothetical protein
MSRLGDQFSIQQNSFTGVKKRKRDRKVFNCKANKTIIKQFKEVA